MIEPHCVINEEQLAPMLHVTRCYGGANQRGHRGEQNRAENEQIQRQRKEMNRWRKKAKGIVSSGSTKQSKQLPQ